MLSIRRSTKALGQRRLRGSAPNLAKEIYRSQWAQSVHADPLMAPHGAFALAVFAMGGTAVPPFWNPLLKISAWTFSKTWNIFCLAHKEIMIETSNINYTKPSIVCHEGAMAIRSKRRMNICCFENVQVGSFFMEIKFS